MRIPLDTLSFQGVMMRLLILASLVCGLALPVFAQEGAKQEVHQTVSNFYEAFNTHDFTRAAALHHH